jgi:3-hydroxybutyryl-CoA dehydratase
MRVSKKFLITEQIVEDFAKVSQDFNAIHMDDEYAKKSNFKGRIVHGMLLGGYISNIIANDYPGEGSIYLNQTMFFLNPCYIGDEVEVIVELIEQVKSKYRLSTVVKNNNDIYITGEALILKKIK